MEIIRTIGGVLLFILLYCLNFMLVIGSVVGIFQLISWMGKK